MKPQHRIARESGTTVPLVALFIVALIAMAALAIDVGVLYTARTSAQHAADAAALAGAFTFLNPVAVQPTAATNAAVAAAAQNQVLGDPVAITASDVIVDVANRRVTVNVQRAGAAAVPTFFAKAIGKDSAAVGVQATAEAGAFAAGSSCVKPVFLPNTILSTLEPPQACAAGELLFDSDGNLTPFAQARLGTLMTIRPTNPADALHPGQFYSLDFGSGASTYRCAWGQCLNYCDGAVTTITCGDSFPIEQGDMVGPTRQGVLDLIGDPRDIWIDIAQYQDGAGGYIKDTSPSLAPLVVWDSCAQVIAPGYAGQRVVVVGFAQVFVDGVQGTAVKAHLVNAASCGTGGGAGGGAGGAGGAPGGATGALGYPIRLVKTE